MRQGHTNPATRGVEFQDPDDAGLRPLPPPPRPHLSSQAPSQARPLLQKPSGAAMFLQLSRALDAPAECRVRVGLAACVSNKLWCCKWSGSWPGAPRLSSH